MKPSLKRIFLDTNILMYDFLARHEEYWDRLPENLDMGLIRATEQAITFIRRDRNLSTYTAPFSLPRLASLLAQRPLRLNSLEIVTELERVVNKNQINGLSKTLISEILATIRNNDTLHKVDVEDAFQWKMCVEAGCHYFLTANERDFSEFSDIQVVLPNKYRNIEY